MLSHAFTIQKYVEKKNHCVRVCVCFLRLFPKLFPVVLHIFSVTLQTEKPTIYILWSASWIVHASAWDCHTDHQYTDSNNDYGRNHWHHKVQIQPFGYPVGQVNLTVRIMLAIRRWCQCTFGRCSERNAHTHKHHHNEYTHTHDIHTARWLGCGWRGKKKKHRKISNYMCYVPLWWLPLLRRTQITIMAIIITRRAATTGTTRFKLDRMMRIVSSAVSSGDSREGAIVPETTNFVFDFFFFGVCFYSSNVY